jgi:outer membrane lipoprotein-sorting protein
MKLALFFSFIFVTIATATPLPPNQTSDLLQKVQSISQSNPALEANFHEERHLPMLKEPVITDGKIWFSLPNKIRREIEGKKPSTTIINSKTMTIYYPKFDEAEQYDLDKRPMVKDSIRALTAGLNFQNLNRQYDVQASGDKNGYQIFLTPKSVSVRRMLKSATLYLSKDYLPKGIDFVGVRGERIIQTYTNVKHDPVPDSTFEFISKPGTKITHPLGS